jgi:hypothetical protein
LGLNYQFSYESDAENAGYAILDVNGDGVQELLIGVIGEYDGDRGQFYDLYTIVNWEAELIAQAGERDRYYLCNGGYIGESGSNSAFESQYSYYDLILDRYDGNEEGWLSLRETIFYDSLVGTEKEPWFYASGSGVMSAEDALPISGDEAHTIMDAYQVAPITYTPFLK